MQRLPSPPQTFKERDMQYLGENPEDILARREWDGADERRQNEWKRRAKQRLQRFPHLSTDPKKEGDLIRIRDSRRKAEDMPSPAAAANDPLRNIFVVSLERRPSKRDHAIRQILECGLAAGESYIVNAVDGDGIVTQKSLHDKDAGVFPGYVGHNMHPIGLTTGEAGCFMSHYSIWLYMHEHNIPYAVILEDDFEIVNPPAFKQAVREVVDEACNSGTWDLLYLSRYPVSFDIQRLSKSLCIPGFSYWTVAYILTLNGARKLLNADGLKNMIGLDDWFSVLDRENVDDACVKPFTERYRSFFPHVLRRLAVVPPLIMPMKGAFFSSDTAKLRKDTRFIADLPIGGSPCLQEWRPGSRARAPGFSSRTPIKEEKLQTCPT
mmetsp:Transcript_24545/g.39396  ORF Transcript_24545/g.39396 Transcript_24545/m.39396 type:complete len:380 (-) Transcript_24545:256-1395(-)